MMSLKMCIRDRDKALFHYKPNARWDESYRTLAALLYPQLADQLEALA